MYTTLKNKVTITQEIMIHNLFKNSLITAVSLIIETTI